jgi:hypothetical protein
MTDLQIFEWKKRLGLGGPERVKPAGSAGDAAPTGILMEREQDEKKKQPESRCGNEAVFA